MTMQQPVRDLLIFLQKHPAVRLRIRAAPNRTLLYAGTFFRPMWKTTDDANRSCPSGAAKETLPDVLARISLEGQVSPTLLAWVKELDILEPWDQNGFIVWRALSGIFASNAVGAVSFSVGSGVDRSKVFAATELAVLLRNPRIDGVTRDVLAYYQRCLLSKNPGMNFGVVIG